MQRLQAYQYEILPKRRAAAPHGARLWRGVRARFVFNKALALQKERYERGEKKLSYYAGLCQLLTQWRERH